MLIFADITIVKKICLVISIVLILSVSAFAIEQDTTMVRTLREKGISFSGKNYDSAHHYFEQSIRSAEASEYYEGLLKSNLSMATFLQQNKQREKSREYLLEALAAARTLKLREQQISILTDLGNQSYRIGEYSVAESYYLQSLALAESPENPMMKIKNLTNIGMAYTKLRDYPKAFDAFTMSNRLADSLNLKEFIGGNYIDIAIIFQEQRKFEESLEYYRKAADVFRVIGDSILVNYAELGIGETFMKMGNYQRAISFLQSIQISPTDSYSQFTFYHNLGISYRAVKKWKEAESSFLKAHEVNDKLIKNPFHTVQNNVEFARLLMDNRRYAQAITLAKAAEAMSREQGVLNNYKDALSILASLYEKTGDQVNAVHYLKQYAQVQDSIARKDNAQQLAEAETRLMLGEKNRELALLEKENELQRQRERSDRITMIVLSGSIFILIVASAVVIRQNQKTKRQNKLLASQKAEIESASAVISEQATKLREVDRMKSRFFANISHELRTPVTLIAGMLEFIRESKNSQKEQERLSIALGNSRKLNAIIEEMLDLTRLEANRIELKKETMAVQPWLNRVVTAFDSFAEEKNIRLIVDHIISQSLYIDADKHRFEKIFNNLIYNAIKFTPSGGWIRIRTSLSTDKTNIDIQVSDSGQGIAEEDLPHIFDRFYQGQSGVQVQGGTGIGLSIAKDLTSLHGGEISVESKPGEGAIFSLKFPLVEPPSASDHIALESEEEFVWKEFRKTPLVLLVEDHGEMRNYVSDLLVGHCEVASVGNGAEALRWLVHKNPDLIISDVMMPVMDGFTLLSKLKTDERLQNIPVIMLTARASEEDKLEGLKLGIDDYVVKPFNALELKIRIQNLLVNQDRRREWLLKPVEQEEQSEAGATTDVLITKIKDYVEKNIDKPLISVPDMARHLGLSERQLYRRTGELTGLAPAQLIKEIRLKKAYQLLIDKKVSKLADLALSVGYESPGYFSRQFAQQFGKRPSEFF